MGRFLPGDATTARAVVLLSYLASFGFAMLFIAIGGSRQENFDFGKYLNPLVDMYSVPLAIVIAGVAATVTRAPTLIDRAQLVLLYGSSAIWNILALSVTVLFMLSMMRETHVHAITPDGLIFWMSFAKDKLAFIVSGILTYVYAARPVREAA